MEGNQMKMREALENIAGYAETARCHTEDVHILSFLGEIEGWARSARSAPARQCDVGTPEEQWKRFDWFCISWEESGPNGGCFDGCPCMTIKSKEFDGCFGRSGCFAYWAQMPYETEGGAE